MNFKEHIKKKDWVFYLMEFLVFVVIFFLGSWLFGGELRKSVISAVVSGIFFFFPLCDAKTGEALPLVNVGLMRTTTRCLSVAPRRHERPFVIKDVKPGQYLLQASCVGYESL